MREKGKFGWIRRFSILIKKVFIIVLLLLLGVLPFAGCDKNKDDNGTKPTQQQESYDIAYTYDSGLRFCRGSTTWDYDALIQRTDFIDTLRLHGNNPKINKINIKPIDPNICGTADESSMVARANDLDVLLDAGNGKVSGEGTTLYLRPAALNNARVQEVFHNKLKANLLEYTY